MFETPAQFSLHIEQLATTGKLSYVDAIIQYCEENSLEPSDVAKFINKPLKDKIENDFRELHMLPQVPSLFFD